MYKEQHQTLAVDGKVGLAIGEYIRITDLRNDHHIKETDFQVRLDVDGEICDIFSLEQQYNRQLIVPTYQVRVMDASS